MQETLYRYLPLEFALQAIQERKLKVSIPNQVNDPYDCVVRLPDLSGETAIQASQQLLDAFSQYFGLISYCRTINDPVVWSHYAEKHTGIALGFLYPEGEDILCVQYKKKRPSAPRDLFEEDADPQRQREFTELMVSTKYRSWVYEREARRILSLSKCEIRKELYFEEFAADLLQEVVIGAKCTFAPIHLRRMLNKHGYPHTRITRMKPGDDTYYMKNLEYPNNDPNPKIIRVRVTVEEIPVSKQRE